ncbi:MAG: hypothetical protein JO088_23260, partial [Acidobacteria bacterium]|nr:hypothetical protein [Acidobacteriota bacterium]
MSFALRRDPRWWAVLPSLLLLAGQVRAQPGTSSVPEMEAEVRKYKSPPVGKGSISDLLRGNVPADPNTEDHRKVLDAEAKLIAYRIAIEAYHKPSNPDAT